MNRIERLNELRAQAVQHIDAYNIALSENDLAKTTQVEGFLKEIEKAYAEEKNLEVFENLAKEENPVLAAATMHSFLTISHKAIREDGVLKGFSLLDDKVIQIDLVELCNYLRLPTDWKYKVEKFNQLMALRTANELKLSKAQIKEICDSFYMNKLACDVELGGTPDSNTAICKQLQKIIDEVLFVDNGKGKNIYKVNNHDVAYLIACYSKRGKKVLSVAVAKSSFVHKLIADILHRIVTGKVYGLEYKMLSSEKVAKIKADEKVAKAEKVKAPANEEPAEEEFGEELVEVSGTEAVQVEK